MITANRLSDGVVVFLNGRGLWTEDFHQGAVLTSETDKTEALARAKASETNNEIVDPYWIDLESRAGHFVPKALREAIRACGPTVRRDLGKQAHGQAPDFLQRAPAEISYVSL